MARGASVRVQGLDRTLRKLNRVKKPIRPLMRKTVNFGRKRVREASKPHSRDVGRLAKGKSIRTGIARGEIPEEGRVLTFSPLVAEVDQGRRRGKGPSIKAMERWARRHGIPVSHGAALALSIKRRGSKGVKMFDQGREALEAKLPTLIREAAEIIEREWRRGR